jgi:hypothetical protein
MTRQEELLIDIQNKAATIEQFKKTEAYKLIMGALTEEINKLKNSYDCKTLQEIATLKGEYKGLTFIPDIIVQYEQAGIISQEKVLKIQKRKAIEESEIDSTDL